VNHEVALKNICDISEVLKEFNCKHWVQDGTLLGFVRENGFISHDPDTDMGILFDSFTPECLKEILLKGFSLQYLFGYIENSFEIALTRSGVKTDLFFHYINENNQQYHCAFANFTSKGNSRFDFLYKPFETKEKEYLGYNFSVPFDEMEFIETKYGSNWSTPQAAWCYATSPFNVKPTGIFCENSIVKEKFDNWFGK